MSYNPRIDSIPGRICAYFAANPEEALSTEDLCIKFDITPKQVSDNLQSALDEEHLVLKTINKVPTWSAGPNLKPPTKGAAFPWLGNGAAAAKQTRKRPTLPPIDVSKISVEKAVPITSPWRDKGLDLWGPLLKKLAEPGMATAPIPLVYRGSLRKVAMDYGKSNNCKFAIRVTGPEEFRLWRTA
jgi:hypothetical protein